MLNDFADWVQSVIGTGYQQAIGMWEETASAAATKYCAMQVMPSPAPNAGDRMPQYRVILVGRREQRQDAQGLLEDAEKLMLAVDSGAIPCGAANIRALGEPVGPSTTTENRSWVQIDFQVMF